MHANIWEPLSWMNTMSLASVELMVSESALKVWCALASVFVQEVCAQVWAHIWW